MEISVEMKKTIPGAKLKSSRLSLYTPTLHYPPAIGGVVHGFANNTKFSISKWPSYTSSLETFLKGLDCYFKFINSLVIKS